MDENISACNHSLLNQVLHFAKHLQYLPQHIFKYMLCGAKNFKFHESQEQTEAIWAVSHFYMEQLQKHCTLESIKYITVVNHATENQVTQVYVNPQISGTINHFLSLRSETLRGLHQTYLCTWGQISESKVGTFHFTTVDLIRNDP